MRFRPEKLGCYHLQKWNDPDESRLSIARDGTHTPLQHPATLRRGTFVFLFALRDALCPRINLTLNVRIGISGRQRERFPI